MRELNRQQKLKVLDKMIEIQKDRKIRLCITYTIACSSLNYTAALSFCWYWTPRFKELNNAIETEVIRTEGGICIHYKNWKKDRIALLKKIRKEL